MSYRVRIPRLVHRSILSWNLPDPVLVDVFLRLNSLGEQQPSLVLRQTREPFDGMEYRFALIDPANRLCEHVCVFHVLYGQDEETLEIVNGGYLRPVGL